MTRLLVCRQMIAAIAHYATCLIAGKFPPVASLSHAARRQFKMPATPVDVMPARWQRLGSAARWPQTAAARRSCSHDAEFRHHSILNRSIFDAYFARQLEASSARQSRPMGLLRLEKMICRVPMRAATY